MRLEKTEAGKELSLSCMSLAFLPSVKTLRVGQGQTEDGGQQQGLGRQVTVFAAGAASAVIRHALAGACPVPHLRA